VQWAVGSLASPRLGFSFFSSLRMISSLVDDDSAFVFAFVYGALYEVRKFFLGSFPFSQGSPVLLNSGVFGRTLLCLFLFSQAPM